MMKGALKILFLCGVFLMPFFIVGVVEAICCGYYVGCPGPYCCNGAAFGGSPFETVFNAYCSGANSSFPDTCCTTYTGTRAFQFSSDPDVYKAYCYVPVEDETGCGKKFVRVDLRGCTALECNCSGLNCNCYENNCSSGLVWSSEDCSCHSPCPTGSSWNSFLHRCQSATDPCPGLTCECGSSMNSIECKCVPADPTCLQWGGGCVEPCWVMQGPMGDACCGDAPGCYCCTIGDPGCGGDPVCVEWSDPVPTCDSNCSLKHTGSTCWCDCPTKFYGFGDRRINQGLIRQGHRGLSSGGYEKRISN